MDHNHDGDISLAEWENYFFERLFVGNLKLQLQNHGHQDDAGKYTIAISDEDRLHALLHMGKTLDCLLLARDLVEKELTHHESMRLQKDMLASRASTNARDLLAGDLVEKDRSPGR